MNDKDAETRPAMFQRLYDGGGWTLGRWHCAGSDLRACEELVGRHEIVIPVRGSFVRERFGEEVLGSPNVSLLADRGDTYRIRHPIPGGDECVVFLIGEDALDDLGRVTGAVTGTSQPRFRADRLPVTAGVFLAAAQLQRHNRVLEPLALEGRVASVLTTLLAAAASPITSDTRHAIARRHQRAVIRATEFIAVHYSSPISLSEIARAAAYSPFHFSRVFRRITGLSPYGYVARLRLRTAVTAVLHGETDLTGLALRTGFSSHSHMTAAFRQEYGWPPSTIRARYR